MMQAKTMLRELLDATPPLPQGDVDAEELLAMSTDMLVARQEKISALTALGVRLDRNDVEIAHVVEELQEREAEWHAAVARAQHVVSERLRACRRLQQVRRR